MRRLFSTLLLAVLLAGPSVTRAARVKGTVVRKSVELQDETLGYTVTQIAAPSEAMDEREQPVALFLKVKTSLPLPPPEEHLEMRIQGLRLVPEIATCAVDAKVTLVNEDPAPVTFMVGDEEVAKLGPNERGAYGCKEITNGNSSELRPVRVKEWPHIRGAIFVGEVGVVGVPDERGSFVMNAPKGQYLLQVVSWERVLETRDVEVTKGDVDVGRIDLRPEDQRTEPPPPPPQRVRRRPPPPAVEEEAGDEDEDQGDEVP